MGWGSGSVRFTGALRTLIAALKCQSEPTDLSRRKYPHGQKNPNPLKLPKQAINNQTTNSQTSFAFGTYSVQLKLEPVRLTLFNSSHRERGKKLRMG